MRQEKCVRRASCVMLLFSILFCLPAFAKIKNYAPEGSPMRAIQDLDTLLDSYILHPKTEEERRYNADLKKKVLQGTFDIRELCRISLNKHWYEISTKEQDQFVDLMSRLLERKAIFSREQGTGSKKKSKINYYIAYQDEKPVGKDTALVRTSVRIPSEEINISLNYKLKKVAGVWKIYDVVVDDACLVDNYKYQFDSIIKKDGYKDLVRRMESKLKELEAKESGSFPPPQPLAPSDDGVPPEKKPLLGCQLRPATSP